MHAAYTLAQLQIIEALILEGNLSGLRVFLLNNPGILEGNDPLAVELRDFMLEQQASVSGFGFSDDDDDDNEIPFSSSGPGDDPY